MKCLSVENDFGTTFNYLHLLVLDRITCIRKEKLKPYEGS